MRMKKFLAATLTAAMVFSLTACGGSSDSSSGKGDTDSSSSDSSGDKISIGFAQVGHESDWRTASTESCRSTFSEENGYDLKFVDCDNREQSWHDGTVLHRHEPARHYDRYGA